MAASQIGTSGMNAAHPLDAFRRRDQAHQPDVVGAAFLQAVDRGHRGVGGREHRRDHDHLPLVQIARRLEVIFDGDERLGLAIKPDMGDARVRHQIEHAFGEA